MRACDMTRRRKRKKQVAKSCRNDIGQRMRTRNITTFNVIRSNLLTTCSAPCRSKLTQIHHTHHHQNHAQIQIKRHGPSGSAVVLGLLLASSTERLHSFWHCTMAVPSHLHARFPYIPGPWCLRAISCGLCTRATARVVKRFGHGS